MRRHGRPELLLILPDAKSLVPAAWTRPGRDSAARYETAQPATAQTLDALTDLLAAAPGRWLPIAAGGIELHKVIIQPSALVKTRLWRMQYRPGLLDGFLASTHLGLTPFCKPHH
jgi:hypothetical protein